MAGSARPISSADITSTPLGYTLASRAVSRPLLGAALGGSTIALGVANSPDVGTTCIGVIPMASMLSGGRFYVPAPYMRGVSGQNSTQILGRLPEVLALTPRPDFCFVHAHFNDPGASIDIPTSIANQKAIISGLLNAGIAAVVLIPQMGSFTGNNNFYFQMAEFFRGFAATQSGILLIDALEALIDRYSSTAAPLSNTLYDGTHPAPYGAYQWAKVIAAKFGFLPSRDDLVRSVADTYNSASNPLGALNSNPMMNGTGGTAQGTATGTVASGWFLDATNAGGAAVAGSIQTDADGEKWQRITISGTATSPFNIIFEQIIAGANYPTTGDAVRATGRFRATGLTPNVISVSSVVQVTTAGGTVNYRDRHYSGTGVGTVGPSEDHSGTLKVDGVSISATVTGMRLRTLILFAPVASANPLTGVIDVGRFSLKRT